ncbi:hypothetical protein AAZX31_15G231000 [Glycine max]
MASHTTTSSHRTYSWMPLATSKSPTLASLPSLSTSVTSSSTLHVDPVFTVPKILHFVHYNSLKANAYSCDVILYNLLVSHPHESHQILSKTNFLPTMTPTLTTNQYSTNHNKIKFNS